RLRRAGRTDFFECARFRLPVRDHGDRGALRSVALRRNQAQRRFRFYPVADTSAPERVAKSPRANRDSLSSFCLPWRRNVALFPVSLPVRSFTEVSLRARIYRAASGLRGEQIWGAHAPRVLIAAPRRNALRRKSSRWRGRHRQHARRVRSPEEIASSLIIFSCDLSSLTSMTSSAEMPILPPRA